MVDAADVLPVRIAEASLSASNRVPCGDPGGSIWGIDDYEVLAVLGGVV